MQVHQWISLKQCSTTPALLAGNDMARKVQQGADGNHASRRWFFCSGRCNGGRLAVVWGLENSREWARVLPLMASFQDGRHNNDRFKGRMAGTTWS